MSLNVLIPAYNAQGYLPRLLDSLLGQTFKDFAIYISDDASTDRSWEIIESYATKFSQAGIPYTRCRNYSNLNVQLNAKGLLDLLEKGYLPRKYITLIESDDAALPTRFEEQINFLEENESLGFSACHSDVQMIYEDGTVTDGFWDLCGGYPIQTPMTFDWLLQNNRVFVCSLMAETNLFKKVFNYQTLIDKEIKLGDYYAALHLTKLTKLGYIPKPLAIYTNRHDSASHSMTREELLNETWKAQELARQDFGHLPQQW